MLLTPTIEIESDNAVIEIECKKNNLSIEIDSPQIILESNPLSMAWGNIGGNIEDQTDLQNALDSKLDYNDDYIVGLATTPSYTLAYAGDNVIGINYANTAEIINNSKTLSYTGDLLTSITHVFDYNSQTWTVTTILGYTGSKVTSKTITIDKA